MALKDPASLRTLPELCCAPLGVLQGSLGLTQAPLALALRWVLTLNPKQRDFGCPPHSPPLVGLTGATRIPADQGVDSKARGSGMDFTPRVSKLSQRHNGRETRRTKGKWKILPKCALFICFDNCGSGLIIYAVLCNMPRNTPEPVCCRWWPRSPAALSQGRVLGHRCLAGPTDPGHGQQSLGAGGDLPGLAQGAMLLLPKVGLTCKNIFPFPGLRRDPSDAIQIF